MQSVCLINQKTLYHFLASDSPPPPPRQQALPMAATTSSLMTTEQKGKIASHSSHLSPPISAQLPSFESRRTHTGDVRWPEHTHAHLVLILGRTRARKRKRVLCPAQRRALLAPLLSSHSHWRWPKIKRAKRTPSPGSCAIRERQLHGYERAFTSRLNSLEQLSFGVQASRKREAESCGERSAQSSRVNCNDLRPRHEIDSSACAIQCSESSDFQSK